MLAEAMLCSPTAVLARSEAWVLQPQCDGWRMLVTPLGVRAVAFTRHGTGITDRLSDGLRNALAALTNRRAVLDGELVCLAVSADGPMADFAALGATLHSGQQAGVRLHYVAFDLLELDGEDLRGRPWRERDAQLRELVAGVAPSITAIDTLPVTADVHHRVVALGFEGSVLKRADAPTAPAAPVPG